MKPEKNDPCPCGSGKTYEKCCQEWYQSTKPKFAEKKTAPTAAECSQLEALLKTGHSAELERQTRLLLEQYPESGYVLNLLGVSLQMQGKDNLFAFEKAAKFLPNDVNVLNNLGNALSDLNRLDEAEAIYRRVLHNNPLNAMALSNMGAALRCMGRLNEAEAICRRALQIKHDFVEAHNNLGNILEDQGRISEAEASYRRALEIRPNQVDAHNNLGNLFLRLGQFFKAEACYRRALEIKPDCIEAYGNLGNVLQSLGKFDEAVLSYQRALEIKPDFADALSNLLFIYNLLPDQPPAKLLAEARRYGELVARQARPYKSWNGVPDIARCLRVGLVSGDLREHAVGFFLEGALSAHAAGRLEFTAYSNHHCIDAVTGRIKKSCRGWHSVAALSDENLARLIHDDGIDILLDLSGHTSHDRLPVFAWKPAPIQVAWLGYFATTGVAAMDYLIADPWTLPETEGIYFTEKIWRLPETRLCFTPPDTDVAVAPLPALTNGYVTFGCFNNLAKMNDNVVALWARVLESVPGSRLLLKAKQLNEIVVRQSVVERFAAHGIGADRILLEGSEARAKYFAAYHRVDIALDPFPFTGGTTSAEGLWMGVPVLTLEGERFLSRQGVGLLMNAGLPEWVAADADDYVTKAISHTGDLQRLATLRSGLRQQVLASPIFDAPRFARNLEAALRGMWAQWCDQQQ